MGRGGELGKEEQNHRLSVEARKNRRRRIIRALELFRWQGRKEGRKPNQKDLRSSGMEEGGEKESFLRSEKTNDGGARRGEGT